MGSMRQVGGTLPPVGGHLQASLNLSDGTVAPPSQASWASASQACCKMLYLERDQP